MGRNGFVLMEAILAVVIISISLTLIMQSLVGSYRNANLQKDYAQAVLILNDHLSKILFDTQDISNPKEQETKFKYEGTLASQEESTIKADLSIIWPSGHNIRRLEVSTLAFKSNEDDSEN